MIAVLREQLNLIYDGDAWYGNSLKSVLQSVNPSIAFISPRGNTHSIAELVAHMLAWREFAELQLKGETNNPPLQEKTFEWKRFSYNKIDAWTIITDRFDSNQRQLLTLLGQQDDSLLERKVSGKPYTFRYFLTGLLQHDLYHLGQIVYIHKLLHKESLQTKADLFRYDYRIFPFKNMALNK